MSTGSKDSERIPKQEAAFEVFICAVPFHCIREVVLSYFTNEETKAKGNLCLIYTAGR